MTEKRNAKKKCNSHRTDNILLGNERTLCVLMIDRLGHRARVCGVKPDARKLVFDNYFFFHKVSNASQNSNRMKRKTVPTEDRAQFRSVGQCESRTRAQNTGTHTIITDPIIAFHSAFMRSVRFFFHFVP